jgi:hypothetical protein
LEGQVLPLFSVFKMFVNLDMAKPTTGGGKKDWTWQQSNLWPFKGLSWRYGKS